MTEGYPEIARVIERARVRQGRIEAGAAALRALAQAIGCLLGGAVGIALGGGVGFTRGAVLVGVLAAVGAEGWRLWRSRRTARDPSAVAQAITAGDPALRSALLSAVELARARAEIEASGRFSLALVDGHLARSAAVAGGIDLVRALPPAPVIRAAKGLGAVAAVAAVALAVGPLRVGMGRVLAGAPEGATLALDPITGDVELTLRYPAYMGREAKTISGTGGEVRAPKGTEVELKARADRLVKAAEIEVERVGGAPAPAAPGAGLGAAAPAPPQHLPARAPPPVGEREGSKGGGERGAERVRVPLSVSAERDLAGRFTVEAAGSWRFRFLDGRGRALAEGPPIPIIVEPDAFPEVRIVAPAQEVEVQPGARLKVEWQASDDVGLGDLALVMKSGGVEQRRPLRKFEGARRDAGGFDLDLAPIGLAEGERLLYWLEVTDGDAVSGPKKGASATHAVKVYSAAEHRRKLMADVRAAWEELVGVLGDHLELGARGRPQEKEILPLAEALDARVKRAHGRLREVAAAIRKDKAGPREVARGLENVAAAVRFAEQRASSTRATLARAVREGKAADGGLASMVRAFDEQLDAELEKGVLYLEQLLDRQQAEDLVRMARELAAARRDLADMLDGYRRAPTDEARQALLARIARMRERMNDLMRRMAEQAKGLSDEHMNRDALEELAKSKDVAGGLDALEAALARGDVEAAMKALDEMGSTMDQMLAGLERTAGMPSERNRELARELREFKRELDAVRSEQRRLGEETEPIQRAWRDRMRERMKGAEQAAARLERLAKEAADAARAAEAGAPRRAQLDAEQTREGLETLQRALAARDLPAALEASRQALGPASRTATAIEEEAQVAERYAQPGRPGAEGLREARRQASAAVQKTDSIRRELERLLPDPDRLLSPEERQRLAQQGKRQLALEQRAGGLQQRLQQLAEKAPIFPPSAAGAIGEARGHMGQASGELQGGNVQRGRAQQEAALEGLDRFARGLEQMAKGGGAGEGFPFPFGQEGMGPEWGDGEEPSGERVEIPGAEAWRAPAEFRKELLDAMKQGTPERYEGEVKRYYEELVR